MLSPDQPVRVVERLVHRVVGDEVFVLMFDSQIHWLKNPSARHVWDALVAAGGTGATPRALAAGLVAEFEVSEAVALADTLRFLANLLQKGLVDSASPET